MSKELIDINLKELIENETGNKFNRDGAIQCPFHADKTPSLTVKFFPDLNKEKFKCWGCDESGDAIDFIQKYKKLTYKKAREYLGLENKKSQREMNRDKILNRIDWDIKNQEKKKDYVLKGLWEFVDDNNRIVYYKAKFIKPNGKKASSYYHFENGKIINNRGMDEIPYNLYNVSKAIQNDKVIIITEGEKDADMVRYVLKGMDYVVTSIKGCIDLTQLKIEGIKIYVIGDTGEAGERYKWHIFKEFRKVASVFKFITLPYLQVMGNNKDVTDWLEDGHSKKELLAAFDRSLDLCSTKELQQDKEGIYKIYFKAPKKEEDQPEKKKFYITDFQIVSAKRMQFVDDSTEGIKLTLKSCTGHIFEKTGPATVFSDVKSFRKFLGTLDLTFKSRIEDLTLLGAWINKYWAVENEEIYSGVKFLEKDEQLHLVTNEGAIKKDKIDYSMKSDNRNNINIIDVENITKDELIQVTNHIFKFASLDKTIPIIGTVINNLAVYQNKMSKGRLHHLLIVGESGSGKSTILKNVVAALLNYPIQDIKSIGLVTPFAFVKDLSDGNYSTLYDEFKPSMMDRYKMLKLSDSLRNLYDRTTISRGSKSFDIQDFQLTRPVIIAGEENYPNAEKALIDRSAIVYLSKRERNSENEEAMKWIIDNEELLHKVGRSLLNIILELSCDAYRSIQRGFVNSFKDLSDRPLSTAINVATGLEIYNILLSKHNISKITGFEKYIIKNIKDEVLDGGSEVKSTVERMIVLYNEMIEDGRALEPKEVIIDRGDGLFIRTSEMINQIHMFINQVGSAEVTPLKLRDFKKQAHKSGYLLQTSAKQVKIKGRNIRFDSYSKERMRELDVSSIVVPEFEEVSPEEQKVIDGVF
ncbi:MAG: CHC2 zinc finger domain-containing protein [Bacilli bacterium]